MSNARLGLSAPSRRGVAVLCIGTLLVAAVGLLAALTPPAWVLVVLALVGLSIVVVAMWLYVVLQRCFG